MEALLDPFEVVFVQRALWGGVLVSLICALAGTWVVLRGMAFLGDAMSHGMLPGVALASLFGGNLFVGAALAAGAMAAGVTALSRSPKLSQDTSIGLLFVGMLSTGVIIVSHSSSFAVDLTGFLFGDVLAVRGRDLAYLAAALAAALLIACLGHRSFVALAFDPSKARTLGLAPRAAHAALLGLVTLAVVASFHVVGTLLVFGLLIAPPAAAALWARSIPMIMVGAALLGSASTFVGLLVSWHWGTAAGATISAVAVALFFVSVAASRARPFLRGRGARTGLSAIAGTCALALLPGCATGSDYYRAGVRSVGAVEGPASDVARDPVLTVLAGRDEQAMLLDRAGLEEGSVEPAGELDTEAVGGVALPYTGRVAAASATDGVLALDLAERAWSRWTLPDVVAVTAIGAGAAVLALTTDGVLHSLAPETVEENAGTELLEQVDAEHAPTIQVDTGRAYVNEAHGGVVQEIDYNDDLRVARTFETGVAPRHMVETGR